nr:MAG TPA: hypothetical protein [Caudoviricetes sp.]
MVINIFYYLINNIYIYIYIKPKYQWTITIFLCSISILSIKSDNIDIYYFCVIIKNIFVL